MLLFIIFVGTFTPVLTAIIYFTSQEKFLLTLLFSFAISLFVGAIFVAVIISTSPVIIDPTPTSTEPLLSFDENIYLRIIDNSFGYQTAGNVDTVAADQATIIYTTKTPYVEIHDYIYEDPNMRELIGKPRKIKPHYYFYIPQGSIY